MVMSATVLAEALLAGGQTGKAIEVLEAQLDKKAEIESFDQARAFFLLARAYRRAHREPEALAMAEKSIKEGFDDSKDAEARVYSKKAHAFLGK
jgi:predicted Zn-dependent protease